MPIINHLRSEFKGSLLVYSVEVDELNAGGTGNSPHKQMVEETFRSIDSAGDHEDSLSTAEERSTWIAIKLVRPDVRDPINTHPSYPDSSGSRSPGVGQAF
jgi:proline dehydrogenase